MIHQDKETTTIDGYFSEIIAEYSTMTYSLLQFFEENISSDKALVIMNEAFEQSVKEFKIRLGAENIKKTVREARKLQKEREEKENQENE